MSEHKITMLEESLWIIRETAHYPDGTQQRRYYETVSRWNKNPMLATIFREEANGEAHLSRYRTDDCKKTSWLDGSRRVYDVVPLRGELLTSPNAVHIKIEGGTDEGDRPA